jgi:hypothetical protein
MSRLRTLRSLRVLDVMYCSILGRPYSTTVIRTDSSTDMLHVPTVTPAAAAVKASFEVCSIIAELTPLLGAESSMDLPTAEKFLTRLRDWSAALPASMRHFNRSSDEPLTLVEQERTIGNIHVSCIYYFAVMLVTRPFLITHLMAQLSNTTELTQAKESSTEDELSELAQACIDAAMLTANMCYNALQVGVLLKQMPLLK